MIHYRLTFCIGECRILSRRTEKEDAIDSPCNLHIEERIQRVKINRIIDTVPFPKRCDESRPETAKGRSIHGGEC